MDSSARWKSGFDGVESEVDRIERGFRGPVARLIGPAVRATLCAVRRWRRFSWTAEGMENLPLGDQPVIFAANHDSHLDTGAILEVLPPGVRRKTAVAAAVDTWSRKKGILRGAPRRLLEIGVASGFHAFPFERHGSALASLQTSRKLLERGWNLLLYPEGTRGEPGRIGEFKQGVGLLAQVTGRPVVPIFVDGGHRLLAIGQWVPNAGHVEVHFGEAISVTRAISRSEATARIREAVLDLRLGVRRESGSESTESLVRPRRALG